MPMAQKGLVNHAAPGSYAEADGETKRRGLRACGAGSDLSHPWHRALADGRSDPINLGGFRHLGVR